MYGCILVARKDKQMTKCFLAIYVTFTGNRTFY